MDVKHQPAAQRQIQRAIERGRLPHAYIFHGPDGVGKELCACGLAELLLCTQPVEHASEDGRIVRSGCGVCEDCRLFRAGTHPDWHLIYRQLNRDHPDPEVRRRKALDVGVDVLRHFVMDVVGHTPLRGRAKVFVIREADRMTAQAQNALLKTLEEPPGTTYIVLLVRSLERLLPTTLSRCQPVAFQTLPTSFIREMLAQRHPELSAAERNWYAYVGAGSVGAALTAIDDALFAVNARLLDAWPTGDDDRRSPSARGDRLFDPSATATRWTELAKELAEGYRKRDPDITDTEATRSGLKTIFQLASAWFADMLRLELISSGAASAPAARPPRSAMEEGLFGAAGASGGSLFTGDARSSVEPATSAANMLNVDRRPALEHWAAAMGREGAIEAVKRLALAERQLDLNANTQLVVETLLNDLSLCGVTHFV